MKPAAGDIYGVFEVVWAGPRWIGYRFAEYGPERRRTIWRCTYADWAEWTEERAFPHGRRCRRT